MANESFFLKSIMKYMGAGGVAEAVAPGAGLASTLGVAGMDAATTVVAELDAVIQKLTKSFSEFNSTASSFGKAMGTGGWFQDFAEVALKADAASASLQRATGQVDKLSTALGAAGLGFSMEESSKAIGELHNNFAGFSDLTSDVMKSVAKQAMGFTRLGVSMADTGKAAETMTKALKMSEKDMIKTQDKIAKAALSLGIAPKKMVADYNKIIPQLMHWGKASTGVFLKLAAQSRATGVEMDALLKVAAGFDEFESAAEKTGKLNMLLGGPYLNTVKMIRADEEERLSLLKQSIKMTGRSIDQLGRWRVRDIAKEMGFTNLANFYKAMGAPDSVIDKYKKKLTPAELAQINLNKAIGKGVKLSEVWQAYFERISMIIGGPFMKVMRRFATFMMSGEGGRGITKVFTWFADGIDKVLKLWDEMDPALVKQIKGLATFYLKMTATSFAVTGFQKVLGPLLKLFTQPSSGLIAVTTWIISNWGGSLKQTVTNLKEDFYELDTTIRDWIDGMLGRWPRVHTAVLTLYNFVQGELTSAFDGVVKSDWQARFVDFIDYLAEGIRKISDFFDHIMYKSNGTARTFTGIITVLKGEVRGFINDVIADIEVILMQRYGRMLRSEVEKREADAWTPVWAQKHVATSDPGWLQGQEAKLAGSLGIMGAQFDTGGRGLGTKVGALGASAEFMDAFKDNADVQIMQSTMIGQALTKLHDQGIVKGNIESKEFWKAHNVNAVLKELARVKGAGAVKTASPPMAGEGLSGHPLSMAARVLGGVFPGVGAVAGAGISIMLDGEKISTVLADPHGANIGEKIGEVFSK